MTEITDKLERFAFQFMKRSTGARTDEVICTAEEFAKCAAKSVGDQSLENHDYVIVLASVSPGDEYQMNFVNYPVITVQQFIKGILSVQLKEELGENG